MEVTPEEAAQAVLLEGMEGTQYITIHRADGASLDKGIPLFTLNGELISEGMVVDMINADVGAEYSTAAQYYEAGDLLASEITEEEHRLTAALVAVQIQQQQKQQLQPNDNSTLSDVVQLHNLEPVDIYSVDPVPGANPGAAYASLPVYKHEEELNFKCEGDGAADSSEDAITTPGLKRSLPHKKRIPRKLKQQEKKSSLNEDVIKSPETSAETTNHVDSPAFKCELCGNIFTNQLKFFEHLKAHYEPLKKEALVKPVENRDDLKPVQTIQEVVEEFSESEDLMEGIRGVVEQTGAHIDFETDNPSPVTNGLSWPSAEEIESLGDIANNAVAMEDLDLQSRLNLYIPKPPPTKSKSKRKSKSKSKPAPPPPPPPKKEKKSKAQRMREEQTCKHCNRYFNHKNSLIYHMRSHSGERPHQCEVCGKSFFAASALKVHKRLHSGDKPYTCEVCGRKFRQWGDLKYHSTSIHSEQRQFQCEYCGKDFARKYSLIVHRRIHTGEKNYSCDFCSKTFRASSYLQNHRKIHTGEKPHPCTICGKPFRVRSDMKRHMQTHTRGKTERTSTKSSVAKPKIQEDIKAPLAKPRTIEDLVHELKLEVEPGSIGRYEPVTLVPPVENHESILPHESANLEYATQNNPGVVGRDLETTIRNAENFHYHLFI